MTTTVIKFIDAVLQAKAENESTQPLLSLRITEDRSDNGTIGGPSIYVRLLTSALHYRAAEMFQMVIVKIALSHGTGPFYDRLLFQELEKLSVDDTIWLVNAVSGANWQPLKIVERLARDKFINSMLIIVIGKQDNAAEVEKLIAKINLHICDAIDITSIISAPMSDLTRHLLNGLRSALGCGRNRSG